MTYLDLLGSGGEELGLDSWLELGGGSVGHLLLLLLGRLSRLHRHLRGADLRRKDTDTVQTVTESDLDPTNAVSRIHRVLRMNT